MFISSRSRQGPHCQAARANWKDLGRRFKRKLLEHFHFYKITHQFLFLLPLELLRSQKALAKTQNKQHKTYPYPLVSFKGIIPRWWQGLSMCPVFASPTRWLRFRLSRWSARWQLWLFNGKCFFSVFIHNIYRESSSNALLSFIFEAADGWFLHQSSRNRCLAALREELTLYETFPKWAHLPRSATSQKPQSVSGLHSTDLSNPLLPNPHHIIQTPHTWAQTLWLNQHPLRTATRSRSKISIIVVLKFRNPYLTPYTLYISNRKVKPVAV